MQVQVAKCSCGGCGVHLEFPLQLVNTSIVCPSCQTETVLTAPTSCPPGRGPGEAIFAHSAEPPPDDPAGDNSGLTLETIMTGFQGKVKWHGTSLFYQGGLALVTVMIVTLPLLYMGLIALAAYGVYWWGRRFKFLLTGHFYGAPLFLTKLMLYIAPLFIGTIIVFFMLKPLLARKPAGVQPLALNPDSEPLLFALIKQICQTIGAPFPK